MDIAILKKEYLELVKMEDTDDGIFDFKKLLLMSDEPSVLDFHFSLLTEIKDEYLRQDIFSFFSDRKDKERVSEFLYQKYKNKELKERQKADIIQLLGHLRSPYAKELALENIQNKERDLRYRSIIVLGWIGESSDLPILNKCMLNDYDGELKSFSATAMRQIWCNYPNTKDDITKYIYHAIQIEKNPNALIGMIITIQDMYRKKFGIKESQYGDISGNVLDAKLKTINFLGKL